MLKKPGRSAVVTCAWTDDMKTDSKKLIAALTLLSASACYAKEEPNNRDTDAATDTDSPTGDNGSGDDDGDDDGGTDGADDDGSTDDGPDDGPDDGTDDDTGSTGGSDAEILEPLIATLCEWDFNCCSDGEVDYRLGPFTVDAAECTERFMEQLVSNDDENAESPRGDLLYVLGYGVRLDRSTPNADQVDACKEELEHRACNEAAEGEHNHCMPGSAAEDSPCDMRNLFTGQQMLGESCSEALASSGLDIECQPGSSCEELDGVYVCVDKGLADEFCESDATCDQELFCDIATGRCAEKSAEGEPCHFMDANEPDLGTETLPCKEYLSCDPFAERCVAYCNEAYTCAHDLACPQDYSCIPVDMDDNTYNYCRERQGTNGDRCDSDHDCEDDMHCDGSACRTDLSQGDDCGTTNECEAGLYCAGTCEIVLNANEVCTGDFACNPSTTIGCITSDDGRRCRTNLLPLSDECTAGEKGGSNWCASGICEDLSEDNISNFECVPGLGVDSPCDENNATVDDGRCSLDNYCFEGFCKSKLDSGQVCEDDGAVQCLNLSCVSIWDSEYCTDLPPVNEEDVVTCDGQD